MKVTLVNHGTAGEWGGGDSVQIQETAKRLHQRGYQVDIQNSDKPDIRDSDLVHIFNSRVYNSFKQQLEICKSHNKPVVLSPIWISIGKALWGSRGTFNILRKAINEGENSIERDYELFKRRNLRIQVDGGGILDSDGNGTYDLEWVNGIKELVKHVDGMLPNSILELKAVQQDLRWSGNIYNVAKYGVDPKKFLDADPNKFREYTGIRGDFVLQAGRVEAGKNQAMLCWAMRNTNIPIVLIGGTKKWPAYAELCKAIKPNNLIIIEHMPQEMLASAYAAARVHTLVSWMDTCGLVSLEAALNGTPLVDTFGHELEYLENNAFLADPADEESIRQCVIKAWESDKYSDKAIKMKEQVLSSYTWEKTANKTEEIYKEVIENA